MRIFTLAVLALVFTRGSAAQQAPSGISPDAYVEQALDLMQNNALHKKSIDWKKVRAETLARAKDAKTTVDTYPALVYALTQLGERHSYLDFPDSVPAEKRKQVAAEMAKIRGAADSERSASPFTPQKEMLGHIDHYMNKKVAHVVVPMCVGQYAEWEKNGPAFQEFADKLHGIVSELQAQRPDGWIVDLRGNGGGNMWPMLAGIGAVLGEADLGKFLSADGESEVWFYKAGQAGSRATGGKEEIAAEIKQPPFALAELAWVALVFDRGTGSSGEAIAISFAGRARERSFGEHTAGFSTSNDRYALPDGAALFLCTGIEADRTGKAYPEGLSPDVEVPAPATRPHEENDAALQSAMRWLAEASGTK